MIAALAAVFVGGGGGALARYGLARWALAAGREAFWGTLAANALACGLLAYLLLAPAREADPPAARLLLATGFCGGFSTFSTFAYEAFALLQAGRPGAALAYVAGSALVGVAAFAAVYAVASR